MYIHVHVISSTSDISCHSSTHSDIVKYMTIHGIVTRAKILSQVYFIKVVPLLAHYGDVYCVSVGFYLLSYLRLY